MIPLLVIGINHESASVDVRERVNFAPERMVPSLQALLSETPAEEAAILSTCNRTELYVVSNEEQESLTDRFVEWLSAHHQLDISALKPYDDRRQWFRFYGAGRATNSRANEI